MATTRAFPAGIVLMTWMLVGTLDLLTACTQFGLTTGKSFTNVLLFVASGFFGTRAFNGDPTMMWWGVLFHYIIALAFTLLFFALFPRIPEMRKYPTASGLIYGIFIWIIMNLLVLPMSNIPHGPFRLSSAIIGMSILMVMIGLPLGLMASKYYRK